MPVDARKSSVARKVRSLGGQLIRRWGLVPAGTPDGVGEDDHLLGRPWPFEVMVYFADTTEAIYQIEQWYRAFESLDAEHRVVVVTRDSRTARLIRDGSMLEVRTIARAETLDDILGRSKTKLILYVNHNPENFGALRFGNLLHVSLMHGDSDKIVTVSNQTKAYDFSFVAGRAAVERMARYATLFDADERCIPVGRPQLDEQAREREAVTLSRPTDDRPTVLYAPTWEGGQPSAAYGSVATHGAAIVRAILDDGRFRLIYRPHPLTGVRDAAYGDGDSTIRDLIRRAQDELPDVGHTVDGDGDLAVAFGHADVLICDVSGVAMDWLATGQPLIVTLPTADVVVARSALTDLVPRLPVGDVDGVPDLVARELDEDPTGAERRALQEFYLGDTTPGASTRRFIEACERLFRIREAEVARVATGALPGEKSADSRETND